MTAPTPNDPARPKVDFHPLYLGLTVVLLGAAVAELIIQGTGLWQFFVFLIAPDIPLFFGGGQGLGPGQLHPRAVGPYNLTHRLVGPIVLAALGFSGLIGIGFGIGALAWGAHIALDRGLGFGLRGADGYQRRGSR
jgi:hypothetical protein